jgi:hypothetical protein
VRFVSGAQRGGLFFKGWMSDSLLDIRPSGMKLPRPETSGTIRPMRRGIPEEHSESFSPSKVGECLAPVATAVTGTLFFRCSADAGTNEVVV